MLVSRSVRFLFLGQNARLPDPVPSLYTFHLQFDDQSVLGTVQRNRLLRLILEAVRCHVMDTDCHLHRFTDGNVEGRGAQIQDARATQFCTVAPNTYILAFIAEFTSCNPCGA
jgi:hypothetical protein